MLRYLCAAVVVVGCGDVVTAPAPGPPAEEAPAAVDCMVEAVGVLCDGTGAASCSPDQRCAPFTWGGPCEDDTWCLAPELAVCRESRCVEGRCMQWYRPDGTPCREAEQVGECASGTCRLPGAK